VGLWVGANVSEEHVALFRFWRWRQCVSSKCLSVWSPHGGTVRKTNIGIFIPRLIYMIRCPHVNSSRQTWRRCETLWLHVKHLTCSELGVAELWTETLHCTVQLLIYCCSCYWSRPSDWSARWRRKFLSSFIFYPTPPAASLCHPSEHRSSTMGYAVATCTVTLPPLRTASAASVVTF
jgi:hypothetical protein